MSYTYHTHETIKVSTVRETEPAHNELYRARRIRTERENTLRFTGINPTSSEEKITTYLDSIKQEITHRSKVLQHQIFEIGRLLCDAKKILPHGEFDAWVSKATQFSKSSALNFMHVYQTCMGYPEVVSFFQPSDLYTIAAPQFPPEFREKLFVKALAERRLNDIGRKQLLEIVERWKQGEVNIDSPEVQELLQIEKDRDYFHFYYEELTSLLTLLSDRREKFKRLDSKFISYPLLDNERNERDEIFDKVIEKIDFIVAEVKMLRDEINPDLNTKRKNCVNTNVTFLEDKRMRIESRFKRQT